MMIEETLEQTCERNRRFKLCYQLLDELYHIYTEEKDTYQVTDIIGRITGTLVLIETDLDGYSNSDHLKGEQNRNEGM